MRFFTLFFMFIGFTNAEEYHFVSINELIEQEIGRIVLPQVYESLDIDITITPLPGKRAQYEATSGRSDGEIMRIFTYGLENPTTHRVPTPYYYLETMAFIKKGSGVKIINESDLSKYAIAKVRGVKHTNNITDGLTNISNLNTTKQVMRFVEKGRADVALTNTVDGLMALKELGINNIIPIEKPLAVLDLFHYIHEDHKDLIPRIDAKIKEMKASGELTRMIKEAENAVIEKNFIIEKLTVIKN